MKKKILVKIAALTFIVVLLVLSGHFFIHGLVKERGRCLLCELLTIGFPCTEQYGLVFLFLVTIGILEVEISRILTLPHLQIQFRAPPEISIFSFTMTV